MANVQKNIVVNSIHRHGLLLKNVIYDYNIDGYRFDRRFAVNPLMDATSEFFTMACQQLGSQLGSPEIDLVVCSGKNNTHRKQVFAEAIAEQPPFAPGRPVETIFYKGERNPPIHHPYSQEALEGKKVVVVDTVVCSDRPLREALLYLRQQRAEVIKVGVLFDS